MKRKKLVFLGILILFVASIVSAEDQKKEISVDEAMKYFSTTWINPAYYESYRETGIKIMNKDGTFEFYSNETSGSPMYVGTYKIEKSWIDKDGNLRLNVIYDEGSWNKYAVTKISDDGNTMEFVYDFSAYPTDLVPGTWNYIIMHKK